MWPFALAGIAGFIYVSYQADKLLSQAKNISELMAPALMMTTFFQTMGLLLQISLSWPPELKAFMKYFSVFNLNIEIVRPDCSIEWDAHKKMVTYLLMPFAILFLIFLYGLFKYLIHEQVAQASGAVYDRRFAAVKASCEKMSVGFFVFTSPSIIKGMCGGFDCSLIGGDSQGGGKLMLDIQPAIECDVNVKDQTIGSGQYVETIPDYVDIRNLGIFGLCMWAIMFGLFVKSL